MPRFAYTAIRAASGDEVSGTVDSATPELASAELKRRGLAPLSLVAESPGAARAAALTERPGSGARPVGPRSGAARSVASGLRPAWLGWNFSLWPAIGTKGLAVFTRQLATLLKAGLPLLRSLEVLGRQERAPAFRAVIERLAEAVRSGGDFSEGLLQYPRIFDRLYVNMVKAGEAGGVLDTVLDRVAGFMEKAERIKGRVKAALTYPAIVTMLAAGIVGALLLLVVPKFEQIFAGLLKGQPLPWLTRQVLGASGFVQHHFGLTALALAAGAGAFVLLRRTRLGTRAWDWLWLRVPVVGELLLKASVARLTRTLGTLLASGVPILQALLITRETSGNVHVAEALTCVHDRVKEGDGVAGPLEATALFPGMVTSMIEVGEETGALPAMLVRIADTYDEEVDRAVAGLTSVIEPIMIVALALLVGTLVIALFLPIISVVQHLQ